MADSIALRPEQVIKSDAALDDSAVHVGLDAKTCDEGKVDALPFPAVLIEAGNTLPQNQII